MTPKQENLDWQDELDFTISHLQNELNADTKSILSTLTAGKDIIKQGFYQQSNISLLLKAHTQLTDAVLNKLWQHHSKDSTQAVAIIAVGGYGRAEMHRPTLM